MSSARAHGRAIFCTYIAKLCKIVAHLTAHEGALLPGGAVAVELRDLLRRRVVGQLLTAPWEAIVRGHVVVRDYRCLAGGSANKLCDAIG